MICVKKCKLHTRKPVHTNSEKRKNRQFADFTVEPIIFFHFFLLRQEFLL